MWGLAMFAALPEQMICLCREECLMLLARVAASCHGQLLASAGGDGTIRIMDVAPENGSTTSRHSGRSDTVDASKWL
jgi:hypothetical protein